jgi:hypothetical protein
LDLYPRLVHALGSGTTSRSNTNHRGDAETSSTSTDDSHPPGRFVPDPPAWWKQRDQTPLKDGAQGWSVFLC